MTYLIRIEGSTQSLSASSEQDLLTSLIRSGVTSVKVGCRGGGCGICKLQLLSGEVFMEKVSRAHLSTEEETLGFILACKAYPRSDLLIGRP